MASDELDYTLIDRPYSEIMTRSMQAAQEMANGNVETQPVKSDGAMSDVWIDNFIRSQNWKPKVLGFYIDGQTGYAEFTNVYVSGNIQALTGSIGGFVIGADYLRDTGNSFGLSSTITAGNDIRMWAGSSFAGRASAPFRVYEDGSVYASSLTLTGYLQVGQAASDTASTISGLSSLSSNLGTITAGTITGALFRTATSGQRIEISSSYTNQIRFFDSTTLYGKLEVYKTGSDGYIGLIAQDDGAGFEVYTGIGASAYSSASIYSVGGRFDTSGNASNGYVSITAKNGGTFVVHGGPSGDEITCDIGFNGISLFQSGAGSNSVLFKASSSSSSYTFTLPTNGGTSGYYLQTNGSGTTSWASVSSGVTALSGLSIDTNKNWGGYTITNSGGITLTGTGDAFDCNDGYLDNAKAIYFATGYSTNPSVSGEIRYYDGGSKGFRGYVAGFRGQFDMTAV